MDIQAFRILHIEDSERDSELIARSIERAGYQVEIRRVDTADAMRNALTELPWDVVLTDYSIPGFNSFQALRIVQDHDEDLPLIVVSGTVGEETAVELMRAGATDYVMKDNLPRLIPAIVREVRDAGHRRARRVAEQRLQQRERMLTAAQRVARLGSWERNYREHTLWWSEEFYAVVGRPLDYQPSTAGSFADLAVPDDREQVGHALAAALDRGELQVLEHRILRADGSVRWVHTRLEPELDEAGRPLRLVSTVYDITERKNVEAELRFQARLLDTVEQAVIATDLDGRIIYWNAFAEAMYGWAAREAIGRLVFDVTPTDISEAQALDVWAHLERGESWAGEFLAQRRDGEKFWAYVSDSPITDEAGRLIGTIGVSFDITEQIAAREALKESEAHYRTLMEQASDGIVAANGDLRFIAANTRACEMFGYSEAEFLQLGFYDFLHPEEIAESPLRLDEVERGATVLNERQLRRKDGTYLPAETSTKMLDDGRLQVIIRDITERKEAEAALRESEANYRILTEQASDGIVVLDENLRVVDVNSRICEMFGYEHEELIGVEPFDFLHPDEAHGVPAAILGADSIEDLQNGRTVVNERRLRHKDGSYVATETSTKMLDDGRVLSLIRDITERKQAEEALRRSERDFRSLFESASDSIIVFSRETRQVLDVNRRACKLYGIERADFIGTSLGDLTPDVSEQRLVADIDHSLAVKRDFEMRGYRSDGSPIEILVSASEITFQGQPAVMSIQHDITERRTLERQLRRRTFYDALTDLPNRTLFQNRVEHAVDRALRNDRKIAVLMLDLDRFQVVNESLGHETGDRLLAAVAERLRQIVRVEDTVARMGGDEFAILLDGIDDHREATLSAERINNMLQDPFGLDGHEIYITASIGLVFSDADRDSTNLLLRNADVATHSAKARGRARYEIYDPTMDASAVERLRLESDLRRAIARDELEVHYQPIVSVASGIVCGMEALVRWNHPVQGRIPPAAFIPLAEDTGLIRDLGHRVLREACQRWRRWHDRYAPAESIVLSVNLSAREFQHPDLVQDIASVLELSGLDPDLLQLEITESVIMADVAATDTKLRQLREIGVRLAIDDFGTGYSSLSYLKRFDVDTLKIDKSFIDGLGEDPEDTAIVQAIMSLAGALNLNVTAEGVESDIAVEQLSGLNCPQAQGYFYAEPLPASRLEDLWSSGLRIDTDWRMSRAG